MVVGIEFSSLGGAQDEGGLVVEVSLREGCFAKEKKNRSSL